MDLKDIVAVTGLGGLYKVAARRNDGMIISSLETGKTTFAAARTHLFTPLDTITMYIEGNDTIELIKVLAEMKKQEVENPVLDAKADKVELKNYFKKILPNYDEEKVYFSDIQKVLKWYVQLNAKGLIDTNIEDKTESTDASTEEAKKETKTMQPKEAPKVVAPKNTKATGAKSAVQKLTNQSKRGS